MPDAHRWSGTGKELVLPAVRVPVDDDVTGTEGDAAVSHDAQAEDQEIVVFWRPACGFCSRLRRRLDGAGVPHRLVNIWEDPEGAATVRSVADGNETVPTVVIGPVGLVNPGLHQVLAAAAEHAPGAVPDGYVPPEPGRVGSWITRTLGG